MYNRTKRAGYIRSDFKEGVLSLIFVSSAINRTFAVTGLRILPTNGRLVLNQRESSRISHSAPHLVCQFTCRCGDTPKTSASDVRTYSQVADQTNVIGRFLVILIVTRGHHSRNTPNIQVHRWTSPFFKSLLHNTDWSILAFSEAVLIGLRSPALCTLKLLTPIAFPMEMTSTSWCTVFNLCPFTAVCNRMLYNSQVFYVSVWEESYRLLTSRSFVLFFLCCSTG